MALLYTGDPTRRNASGLSELPEPLRAGQNDPRGYRPDPGLIDAVNVALMLGQPLLLTGEPGTGKTQLAFSIAWELGDERVGNHVPLMFETKSTSAARDLFYTYDTLGRFHAAQTQEGSQSSVDYISYNALGAAILRANEREAVERWLPGEFKHNGRQRSVVLIDEIDKAPRDFPNDILNEVENMYFKVPELGNQVFAAPEDLRPVLIMTSNSEKQLPDAFLRRSIFYNIPFPDEKRLIEIVYSRIPQLKAEPARMLNEALELFSLLREPSAGLAKRPATAELLGWLLVVNKKGVGPADSLRRNRAAVTSTISTLIKSAEDQKRAEQVVVDWLK
ncbi:MAG TPA: MoxR family ATPase [Blastocatellia bacterium]|nr:MoxR family ATPase [Blastocatellia bacterium]